MSNIKDYSDYEHLLSAVMSNLDLITKEAKRIEDMMFDVDVNNLDNSWKSGDEISHLREGEVTIFDYRPIHEVNNNGDTGRVPLLVLLPIEKQE